MTLSGDSEDAAHVLALAEAIVGREAVTICREQEEETPPPCSS